MRSTLLLVLLALFVPTAALAQSGPDEEELPAAARVVVLGDSHVERLGPMLERAVRQNGHQSVDSLARRGWSTRRYLREGDLDRQLAARGRPNLALVSLGGNDRTRSDEVYAEQLGAIVRELRDAGVERIVWLGAGGVGRRPLRARGVGRRLARSERGPPSGDPPRARRRVDRLAPGDPRRPRDGRRALHPLGLRAVVRGCADRGAPRRRCATAPAPSDSHVAFDLRGADDQRLRWTRMSPSSAGTPTRSGKP